MQKNALQNYALSPTIHLPIYSGHRRTWIHPQRSAQATGRLRAERKDDRPRLWLWTLITAIGMAATFWRP